MLKDGETGQGNLATASGAAAVAGTAKGAVTCRRRRRAGQGPPPLLAANPRPK